MEKEKGDQRSPRELNAEFRKILGALPTVQLSMIGGVMDSNTNLVDMTDEERAAYKEIAGERFDPESPWAELYSEIAKGKVMQTKRLNADYTYAILNKLPELLPKVQGTEMFTMYYVPRAIKESIVHGTNADRKSHELYGDDRGGIFHPVSVEAIEEHSFQRFFGDIEWYGKSLFGMPLLEIDYEDEDYQGMVDKAKVWKGQFIERYKRVPLNVFGGEIIIP